MNNETKAEILGSIRHEYLASAAQKRMKYADFSGSKAKKPIMKYIAAIAACFVIVVLQFVILQYKNSLTTYKFYSISDLPITESTEALLVFTTGNSELNGYYTKSIGKKAQSKIFNISGKNNFPGYTEYLSKAKTKSAHNASGELSHVIVDFDFNDDDVVTVTIYSNKSFDHHYNGTVETTEVNGYIASFIRARLTEREYPESEDDQLTEIVLICLERDDISITICGENNSGRIEDIYNFILNSSIDIKDLK